MPADHSLFFRNLCQLTTRVLSKNDCSNQWRYLRGCHPWHATNPLASRMNRTTIRGKLRHASNLSAVPARIRFEFNNSEWLRPPSGPQQEEGMLKPMFKL